MTDILLDACVMLEILRIDETILHYIGRFARPTFISKMLSEVPSLTEEVIETYGIKVIDAHWEDIVQSSIDSNTGPLSRQDILFFLTAKRLGDTCITMDQKLYERCISNDVPVYRFFALLKLLVSKKIITKNQAREYVYQSQNNPWIGDDVINEALRMFEEKENT